MVRSWRMYKKRRDIATHPLRSFMIDEDITPKRLPAFLQLTDVVEYERTDLIKLPHFL